MGQEASVPRNSNASDELHANHQAPPQGGRDAGGVEHTNAAVAAVVSPSVAAGGVGLAGGGVGGLHYGMHHQPQSQQQQQQQQHDISVQATPGKSSITAPPAHPHINIMPHHHHHTSAQQPQGVAPTSASLMSRAGLTSMIQRMGGSSRGLQATAGGRLNGKNPPASPINQLHQQQPHSPRGGGDDDNSSPRNIGSNGVHTPTRQYRTNFNDLSPESKARQQAMMMKKQQQMEQQQQQQIDQQQQIEQQQHVQHHEHRPPPSTQQSSSSYHTANSSTVSSSSLANTIFSSEIKHPPSTASSAITTNVSKTTVKSPGISPVAQGMSNISLSGQQQYHPQHHQHHQNQRQQQPQPLSPPSPRQQLLKKMQNNDEEDWQKAWEEDGESSDEDEDEGGVKQSLPTMPLLTKPSAAGGQGQAPAIAPLPLPHRFDVDTGHSSASLQVIAPKTPTAAMQQLFAPTNHHHQQQQLQHPPKQHFIGNQKAIATAPPSIKTPIVQYPPPTPSHLYNNLAPLDYRQGDMNREEDDVRLARQANEALQGDDGQERWDSHFRADGEEEAVDEDERPCVDMFQPALRVLGRGSFGRVVLVQKRYGPGIGSLYAMKILRKSHLVRRRQIERTKTERKVLSVLDHPFIMKMYYAFQTSDKLYLVLDYCPGGELFFHLSRYRRFQEPVSRFYAAELLLAIGHLHKNGIIYRDLKPENVLLDAYGHVKLGDFGLAKDGIRHPTQGAKSTCGTPEYMAPEVLNQAGHGFCVDYWGLGMILYEMMTGLPPWYTTDRSKLFRRLRSAPLVFPNEVHFSPHCRACIAGLLEREPRLRLGVMGLRSAMRHEFFYRRINFEALRARRIAAPIRPCEGWRQLQSRGNSGVSDSSAGSFSGHSGGWHSAGPSSLDSATLGGITAEALDVATANFDDSFRRMPLETEDYERQQQAAGHAPISEKELNAGTFRGFTFDGDLPMNNEQSHQPPARKPPSGHHDRQTHGEG